MDEDITVGMDIEGKLVSIEILAASEHINLSTLLPVKIKKKVLKQQRTSMANLPKER